MTEPFNEQDGSRGIWLCAGLVALACHAALGIFAAAQFSEAEVVDLGAPGIEIGLELTSPKAAPSDLPPGPDSEASIATPPVMQQVEESKESELPQDKPTEVDEPDQLVTENKSKKKPEEETPEVKAKPTPPSEASVAQEATAMPSMEAVPEAPESVTRDPGTGDNKQRIRATWQRELVAHLDKHKRYPNERARKSAELTVNLVLDRTGKVVSATVIKGSGDAAFDEAALAMIRRSDPVPAPPALVADDGLSFLLPVSFKPRTKS